MHSPHIILWYIGPYGLKRAGAEFYRDAIISPIISENKRCTFLLVDLTAWGGLRDPNVTISHFSSHAKAINDLNIDQIRCVKSSDTFREIQEIKSQKIVNYFQKSIRKCLDQDLGFSIQDVGFTTASVFSNHCPIMEECFSIDASKSYSPLQYLEAFVLIENILRDSTESSVDIVFALPNNEFKYYQNEQLSFKDDLIFFLKHRSTSIGCKKNVRVCFYSFPYGEIETHRPYRAPGESIKKGELRQEVIINPGIST